MVIAATMRAVEGAAVGPVNTLEVVTNRPVPKLPAAGAVEHPAVIIKVEYAALNPIDWKMKEMGALVEQWPYAFGCDLSGEVVEVSEGIELKAGDKVWAFSLLGDAIQGAAFAEYAIVPGAMVAKVPSSVSMEAACTVGLSSLTAAMGLFQDLELPMQAPEPAGSIPVLVYGASSSTGVLTVSMLKHTGYRAIAVASKKHHEWLLETVGAAQAVDYRESDWIEQVVSEPANAGLKHVIDCIGQATPEESPDNYTGTLALCDKVLTQSGAGSDGAVSTVNAFTPALGGQRKVVPIRTFISRDELDGARKYVELAEKLLEEGKLMTMPTTMLGGLDAVPEGLQKLKDGVSGTKLVVKV